MAEYSLSIDHCLRVLHLVDSGALAIQRRDVNGGFDYGIFYGRAFMESLSLKGLRPGVALDTKSGRTLVRRGHARSERRAVSGGRRGELTEYRTYYWITATGREAAERLPKTEASA
ncbi:hypothetical protein [Paraburkholderia xenovorans]